MTKDRVDGIAALRQHMKVRLDGDTAVLTFNWETYSSTGELTSRWNATELFVRSAEGRPEGLHY